MALLTTILAVGLIAAGLTQVVRAVVPQQWLLNKPLSCDLCMSWWSSLAGVVVAAVGGTVAWPAAPLVVPGSVAVSLLTLKAISRMGE